MEVEGRFEDFSCVDNDVEIAEILPEDEIATMVGSNQQEIGHN